MDFQTSKIELAKLILDLENPKLITRIMKLLKSESKDFWNDLSDQQKNEIEIAISELDRGEGISWDEFRKQVS
mgnify:CR=1 FL=1